MSQLVGLFRFQRPTQRAKKAHPEHQQITPTNGSRKMLVDSSVEVWIGGNALYKPAWFLESVLVLHEDVVQCFRIGNVKLFIL
jgi:hypothetical protein